MGGTGVQNFLNSQNVQVPLIEVPQRPSNSEGADSVSTLSPLRLFPDTIFEILFRRSPDTSTDTFDPDST